MNGLIASCVVFVALAANAEVRLPQGWRRPAAGDNQGCGLDGHDQYRVVGDFDGDGRSDEAHLLFKPKGSVFGLWVWLGDREPLLLFHWELAESEHKLGIRLVPGPGSSETWCGRYDECEPGEPKKVSWAYDSLDLYWCESSSQLVWWDAKKQGFRAVWMSD